MQHLFVTGIGTGVGKTIVSAMLVRQTGAAYWKPVQTGDPGCTDSRAIRQLTGPHTQIHPERYRFHTPVSPHEAAAIEQVTVRLEDFRLPPSDSPLIVEGAGGLYAPLNNDRFMIDLIEYLELPAVLVVRDYLGCINHTMMSLEALRQREIPVSRVVLNGFFSPATKDFIAARIPAGTALMQVPELPLPEIRRHIDFITTPKNNS